MKRIFTALLLLTLCAAVMGFGQTTWQFVKVFPDTNISFNTGIHGLTVDPDGKVWAQAYGTTGKIFNGVDSSNVREIFVFNPDGSQAAFSRFKTVTIGSTTDTLFNSNRGMRADADGNVVFASFDVYYKVNYKTGAGIAKVAPVAGQTLTAPAFTAANEMFSGFVIPGNPMKIFDGTFTELGTAITSLSGYSRSFDVSADGNDIYWGGYTLGKIYVYHSDIGTLGTYTVTDSFATGFQAESFAWNKKDGHLYISSFPVDTVNYPAQPGAKDWKAETWYAFDVATKTAKDSLTWNRAAYPYPGVDLGPRPRAIGFSPSGDTAYVAGYNYAKAAIQMFRRVPTGVEPAGNEVPDSYVLSQNYPNPFNPSTEIQFALPKAGFTTLKVFDVMGREVATLVNEELAPGSFKVRLDGSKLSSGTYIYTLVSGNSRITKKMMLLK